METQEELARRLRSALEQLIKNLEYPMYIGSLMEDAEIRKAVGSLSAHVISEIDFEIMPKIVKVYSLDSE